MEELEGRLMLGGKVVPAVDEKVKDGDDGGLGEIEEDDSFDDYSGGEDEDEEDTLVSLKRLRRRVEQFVLIRRLAEKLGEEHPFVAKREERREKLRKTLLLDMGNAMKRAIETNGTDGEEQLYMLKTYELMGAPEECLAALKQTKVAQKKEKGKGR